MCLVFHWNVKISPSEFLIMAYLDVTTSTSSKDSSLFRANKAQQIMKRKMVTAKKKK